MNYKKQLLKLDYWLIIAVCALSIFGIVCIGSATHINLGESSSNFYSQMVWFAIGLVLMVIAALVDYNFFSQFYNLIYGINILMLIAVIFIGSEVNGATRWIRIGPVGIQPSEFGKIIMIFCLAKIIDKKKESINNISMLFFLFVYTIVPVVLILKQPSLSAGLVILAILLIQMFVAGLSYKLILKAAIVAVPTTGLICWDALRTPHLFIDKVLEKHQLTRILTFLRPEDYPDTYYQTMQSINAIGSGQLNGKRLYQGTLNQLSYLPEPHNDFIFAVIGEEFGFIGCIAVLLLLLFIVFRCMLIAMSTRDLFSQLIVSGIGGMIAFQTFVNIGVTTGIIPNTGMSLPFVSYGGSSMWVNMIAIGLVLNIELRRSKSLFEGV